MFNNCYSRKKTEKDVNRKWENALDEKLLCIVYEIRIAERIKCKYIKAQKWVYGTYNSYIRMHCAIFVEWVVSWMQKYTSFVPPQLLDAFQLSFHPSLLIIVVWTSCFEWVMQIETEVINNWLTNKDWLG